VLGGFPGLGIGRISAIRQEDGTSPESHDKLAVWRRQRRPSAERFRSMVLEISSGPAADLNGSLLRAEISSPFVNGEHGWYSSSDVVQLHGEDTARRASNVICLSAALSFGSLVTVAYYLQNKLALAEFVEAILPSSDEMTEDDCAGGVLPSIALMTLQISAELSSLRLSVTNSCQRALASSIVSVDSIEDGSGGKQPARYLRSPKTR